jgi:hypothetical protein
LLEALYNAFRLTSKECTEAKARFVSYPPPMAADLRMHLTFLSAERR